MKKIALLIFAVITSFILNGVKAQTLILGGGNATAGLETVLLLSIDKLLKDSGLPADGADVTLWLVVVAKAYSTNRLNLPMDKISQIFIFTS